MTDRTNIDWITESRCAGVDAAQIKHGLRRIANSCLPSSASPRRVNQKVNPQ